MKNGYEFIMEVTEHMEGDKRRFSLPNKGRARLLRRAGLNGDSELT